MREKSIKMSIVALGALAMLFSCRGDLEAIDSLTQEEKGPMESAFQVEIIYSDHGQVRMILNAARMDRYEGEKPYLEMPEGIHMIFYDTLMQESSSLRAQYAISYEDSELIEARRDVIVINDLGERLNTEQLIWDQKEARIYSGTFVKVTTEEEVLYGDGFESDERFDRWRILNPHGTFQLDTRTEGGRSGGQDPVASTRHASSDESSPSGRMNHSKPASEQPDSGDRTPAYHSPQNHNAGDTTQGVHGINAPDIQIHQRAHPE